MTVEKEWGWSHVGDEIAYGPFESRDAAVANARGQLADAKSLPATIVLGRCCHADPADYLNVDDLVERMDQQAYDNEFNFTDDPIFSPREGAQAALVVWAREWLNTEAVWHLEGAAELTLELEPGSE